MKKISKLVGLAAIVLSGAMLSCSSSEEESIDLGEAKQVVNMLSDPQPIQLAPEQRIFANDNNQFTLKFLKTVNETDQSGKSFIYSPLSITYVLGMVNDAAEGETERELEQTLGFHEGGIQAVNDYCKKLIEGLPKVDEKVTLDNEYVDLFKKEGIWIDIKILWWSVLKVFQSANINEDQREGMSAEESAALDDEEVKRIAHLPD